MLYSRVEAEAVSIQSARKLIQLVLVCMN